MSESFVPGPQNVSSFTLLLYFNKVSTMSLSHSDASSSRSCRRFVSRQREMDNGRHPERSNQVEVPKDLLQTASELVLAGRYMCNDLHKAGVLIATCLQCREIVVKSRGASSISLTAYRSSGTQQIKISARVSTGRWQIGDVTKLESSSGKRF